MSHANQPNVVFIIADDHRAESVNAFGNKDIHTPTLDALAKEGTSFSNTHIFGGLTGAVCAPSRACVNSGISIFRSMIGNDVTNWDHAITIRSDVVLMPQAMKNAGYVTHAIGKWHNDKPSFARSFTGGDKLFFGGMSDHWSVPVQDFDPDGVYPVEREYIGDKFSTELFSDAAIQFVENYTTDQPFYLYIAYTAPHDPRTAPEPFASMYDPSNISLPPNFSTDFPFDNGEMDVRDEHLAEKPRHPAEIRRHIADYYGMITHMDAQIARVVEALKAKGIYDNTIIVYTADHGISLGQHGLMGKQNVFEHSVRIPLIVKGPGIPTGVQLQDLTSNIDIFPTLAELCGLAAPEVDGTSMIPLLKDKPEHKKAVVGTVYADIQRMIRDDRWKLIRYYVSESSGRGSNRLQLFDLEQDPWETTDVSSQPANTEHINRLAAALQTWMVENGDILQDVPVLLCE
ncbi:sulfatase [Paenibacillus selenitireducens]|uniref:Sulfatase n=1 Tax=Paenibacillus selenitireducens TaxID=1324314 RepID=A0A1T2X9T6_9BACL|nr:sulfatase-like hydrolase/transferase [Paenibacillus selenitireducens]OPA76664.1 sulfatase [Paenibacillus selenitireducens]